MRSALPAATACLIALAGCGGRGDRELREWRPEDHQPPAGGASAEGDRAAPPPETEGADADPAATEVRAATALFRAMCASCHGAEGRGDGPGRPPVAQIPSLAAAEWQASRSDEEIAAAIREGRGGFMPAFGDRLSAEGVAALVRHVRRLGPGSASGSGAATESGARTGTAPPPEPVPGTVSAPDPDREPVPDPVPGASAPAAP